MNEPWRSAMLRDKRVSLAIQLQPANLPWTITCDLPCVFVFRISCGWRNRCQRCAVAPLSGKPGPFWVQNPTPRYSPGAAVTSAVSSAGPPVAKSLGPHARLCSMVPGTINASCSEVSIRMCSWGRCNFKYRVGRALCPPQ